MIMPKHGFIPPMYQQVINIGWQDKPVRNLSICSKYETDGNLG
jgi:hypothetical protein